MLNIKWLQNIFSLGQGRRCSVLIATSFLLGMFGYFPAVWAFPYEHRPMAISHGFHGGGHWVHDRHLGRLGWWWVAGPSWQYYSRPVVVSPPQTVIIQQAPPPVTVVQTPPAPPTPVPVLYYCKATGTYYPDTMTCPGGWSMATAGTPPTP